MYNCVIMIIDPLSTTKLFHGSPNSTKENPHIISSRAMTLKMKELLNKSQVIMGKERDPRYNKWLIYTIIKENYISVIVRYLKNALS